MKLLAYILFFFNGAIKVAGQKQIIVAQDGSGNYRTVTDAIKSVKPKTATIIYIQNGTYREKILVDSLKENLTLVGEDRFKTIILFNDHSGRIAPNGDTINTRTSYTFKVTANNFTAREITFSNDAGYNAGQAVAMESNGDRALFINCRFTGNQDVLFTNTTTNKQFFLRCYIEGTTDFIFGAGTAWFEQCHIHSKKNSHVTAAATLPGEKFGYIFNDCVLTGDTSLTNVSLGRPWRQHAAVIFMNSYLGPHIRKEGWSKWNNTDNHLATRYAEYRNYGPSSDTTGRISWSRQLTEKEAAGIRIEHVFHDWKPLQKLMNRE